MLLTMNRPRWIYGTLVAAALLTAACEKPGEALTDRKTRENEEEIKAYIAQNNLTATRTEDGLYFIQTKTNPPGQLPQQGDEVKYHFITRRLDGIVVDSSDRVGNVPAVVNLAGDNTLITRGRYEGILRLRQGEEGAVLVPAHLDGGRVGSLLLPQYVPVRYDLRIVSVRTEEQQIEDYIKNNAVAVTSKDDNGLRVAITQSRPDSAAITTGKTVTLNYTGRRAADGVIFDGTYTTTTRQIQIGAKSVPLGLENGLTKLKAGEKAVMVFPSALGYTTTGIRNQSTGAYTVQPNSPLVYDVTVTKVQ